MQAVDPSLKEEVNHLVRKLVEEKIKDYVREVIAEFVKENELRARELSLIERIIKIEEELKALRELSIT